MQTVKEQCSTALNDKEKEYQPPEPKPVYEACKRIFDVVMSAFAMVALSPVFLATAIAIKLEDGGKVFYSQTRLTKGAKEFEMYKFRSMCPNADQMVDALMEQNEMEGPAFKIKDDPRVTKVGKFIRKTSIDELPQLINVFLGNMSIVGPRPALPREVEQYDEYAKQRLLVTPGLTCIWQVQPHRNSLSFDEWLELDIQYIRYRSFRNDWKIIFQTFGAVLGMNGE